MKYFFRGKIPRAQDILVLESGSPGVARRAVAGVQAVFPDARYHLCTCWPDPPAGAFASIFRVAEYPGWQQKLRLLLSFRQQRWPVLVILCTGEPIMGRWKLLAVLLLPAKVLIVNENADFFWLDWHNRKNLRRLLSTRWGLKPEDLLFVALRAALFPFTLLLLLATALWFYSRRWSRLLARKIPLRTRRLSSPTEAPPVLQETSKEKFHKAV